MATATQNPAGWTIPTTGPPVPQISGLASDGRKMLIDHVKFEISALKGEVKILEETLKTLQGSNGAAAPVKTRAGNGQHTTSRKPRARAPKLIQAAPVDAVLDAIKSGACDTSAKLSANFGVPVETILRRLRALEAKGMIRREGTGRDTRWVTGISTP